MPRECIIILGLHMGTNFILSVCFQLNEAYYNYSFVIVLALFVFSFSLCFSAFLHFSFLIYLHTYWGYKMSLCPYNGIQYMCLCEWRWNKLKSQVSTQSGLPHHDCILAMCQISKSAALLRNTLSDLHQVGKRRRFCLWFLPPDDLFSTVPPRKSNAILSPYLQSKCRECTKLQVEEQSLWWLGIMFTFQVLKWAIDDSGWIFEVKWLELHLKHFVKSSGSVGWALFFTGWDLIGQVAGELFLAAIASDQTNTCDCLPQNSSYAHICWVCWQIK